jgi:hypothetical protein
MKNIGGFYKFKGRMVEVRFIIDEHNDPKTFYVDIKGMEQRDVTNICTAITDKFHKKVTSRVKIFDVIKKHPNVRSRGVVDFLVQTLSDIHWKGSENEKIS